MYAFANHGRSNGGAKCVTAKVAVTIIDIYLIVRLLETMTSHFVKSQACLIGGVANG